MESTGEQDVFEAHTGEKGPQYIRKIISAAHLLWNRVLGQVACPRTRGL
jgi:hypothetical protein